MSDRTRIATRRDGPDATDAAPGDERSRAEAARCFVAAYEAVDLRRNNLGAWEGLIRVALEVCFGPFLTRPSWKSLGEAERENYAQYIVRSTLPEEALTMAPVATLYAEAVRIGMNHWLPCHRREAMRKASAHLAREDGTLVPITRNQELVMDLMRQFYRTADGDPYVVLAGLCAGLAWRVNYSRRRPERSGLRRDDILAVLVSFAPDNSPGNAQIAELLRLPAPAL